jgi:hypothetical protein
MSIAALKARLSRTVEGLGPRDRKAIRSGAVLLLPALLYIWLAKPILESFSHSREVLATERDLLQRETSLLDEARQLPSALHLTDSLFRSVSDQLFQGKETVSATAALARHVADRAVARQVMVQSSEARPCREVSAGLFQLAVEVRAIGDLQGITRWLADLERGAKLVQIEELKITAAQRIAQANAPEEEVLGVALRVSALASVSGPAVVAAVP